MAESIVSPVVGGVPVAVTSFVGRRREIAEVAELTAQHRLVTLIGPGGVGKTRLAMEVAGEISAGFTDGIAVVELASVPDAGLLPGTVAAALGLRDQSSRPLADQLLDHLRHRRMLIVLDNCEHLAAACAAFLDWLLKSSPDVRLLATSRRTFGIGGEQVYSVPPLSIPDDESPAGESSEAVELLVVRARAVFPEFAVTAANERAVATLCTRLDGLPLAIELAATRLRALSVDQLADRVQDRFRLLTGGSPVAVPRQQTLRALIDWSHDLCTPTQQLLWARLSVFSGGFDLAAAEGVCAHGELGLADVLDGIDQLVAQSIVLTEHRDGRFRYRMLETIREYGRERLAGSAADAELQRRHRDFYLALAEETAAQWCGPDQADGLRRLRTDQGNVRAALDFSAAQPDGGAAMLRLTAALRYHWFVGGYLGEGRRWLDHALDSTSEPSAERAAALWVAAWVTLLQGDMAPAIARLDECEQVSTAIDDRPALAYTAHVRGTAALFRGEIDAAIAHYQQGRDAHRAVGADDGVLSMLFQLAMAQSHASDPDGARATCQEALDLSARHGERWGRSYAMWVLAFVIWQRGDGEASGQLAREALEIKADFTDGVGAALIIELLAWIAGSRGDFAAAARLLGAAESIWRHLGTSMSVFGPQLAAHHQVCEAATRRALGPGNYAGLVAQSARCTPAEAIATVLGKSAENAETVSAADPVLTRREREVAELISRGMSNRAIAAHLVVSPRTVDSHVEHIFGKLGFSSRAQLAVWMAGRRRQGD